MPGWKERKHNSAPEVDPKQLIESGIQSLLTELSQGKSERLEKYLAFASRFHRYSAANQLLIYLQRPDATFVAGYRAWQDMGYQVAAGEKGIRILAPRPYKRLNRETEEEEELVSFAAVSVFDASQLVNTAEKPLPTFFTPLADDQQALYARLRQVVEADGITITETQTGLAQGYSASKRIALREGLDSRSRVLTLLHEYAHELLHWDAEGKAKPRQVKECQAESVSYLVARRFNLHNPFSADYLQNWGTTPKELIAELEVVRRTAAYIINRIEDRPPSRGEGDANFMTE